MPYIDEYSALFGVPPVSQSRFRRDLGAVGRFLLGPGGTEFRDRQDREREARQEALRARGRDIGHYFTGSADEPYPSEREVLPPQANPARPETSGPLAAQAAAQAVAPGLPSQTAVDHQGALGRAATDRIIPASAAPDGLPSSDPLAMLPAPVNPVSGQSLAQTLPLVSTPPYVPQPAAPEIDIAAARERAMAQIPGAPKPPAADPQGDAFMTLLRAGLATMAAGSQPGATALGAIGQGGLTALEAADRTRRERQRAEQAGFANEMARRGAASTEAAAEANIGMQRYQAQAQAVHYQNIYNMQAAQLKQQMGIAGLNRDSQERIAAMGRETQQIIAAAQLGNTRAIHAMDAQTRADQNVAKQVEDTVQAMERNPNRVGPVTEEERAAVVQRVAENSPGTTQHFDVMKNRIATDLKESKARIMAAANLSPQQKQEALRRLDDDATARLEGYSRGLVARRYFGAPR